MTRSVLISGYYGAGNLGDEALLAGLLHALKQAGTQAPQATVASMSPQTTCTLHGVRAANRLWGLPAALLASDALVSGGGGLLQDATSRRSLDYYLATLQLARTLGKRRVVYAQSLGPLTPAGASRVARVLDGVALGLRDEPSLLLAQRLGLSAQRVGDAALLLPQPAQPLQNPEGPWVLVPRGGHPHVQRVLAWVAARARDLGRSVRVIVLHPAVDAEHAAQLRSILPSSEAFAPTTPAHFYDALAGAALMVSGRLHGLILGAHAQVPVAGVAYDPKVAGFAHAIGAPIISSEADASQAPEIALEPFLQTPRLDAARVEAQRSLAREGFQWLLQQLHGSA